MRVFRAIVMDVWQSRRASAEQIIADLTARLAGLQRREALLEEAFLFARSIGAATYERQRDKVRGEIALARIELEDAKLEEIDLDGVLGFAEHVLGNAARLGRKRDQSRNADYRACLFPEGLRIQDGKFRTAVTCFIRDIWNVDK